MEKEKTFRERYMAGDTDFDEIFDLTQDWGLSDTTQPLRTFLGLTQEEEDVWVSESDEALQQLMEREKNRRIFFTDLDGTLLNDAKQITPQVRETIHEALDAGHVIVLSTGRTLHSTLRQAKRLDMMHPGCYLITFNGAQVYDIAGERMLSAQGIPMDLVRYCFDAAKAADIHIQTYQDEYVLSERNTPEIGPYCEVQMLPYKVVDRLEDILRSEPPKMLVIENDPEKLSAFRQQLAVPLAGKLDLFLSQKNYLEIVPANVNKGTAVVFLCDYLGVPLSRSVAAGDMENDTTMIEAAGIGAVMCNGTDALKAKADYITRQDNNHSGTAEIIRKFILCSDEV